MAHLAYAHYTLYRTTTIARTQHIIIIIVVGYYDVIISQARTVRAGRTVENTRAPSRDDRPAAEIDNDRNDVHRRENLTRGIIRVQVRVVMIYRRTAFGIAAISNNYCELQDLCWAQLLVSGRKSINSRAARRVS